MAKNVIKGDLRSSKMAAGSHFVRTKNQSCILNLKWREMRSKVIFCHPKWPLAAMFVEKNQKNKSCVLI